MNEETMTMPPLNFRLNKLGTCRCGGPRLRKVKGLVTSPQAGAKHSAAASLAPVAILNDEPVIAYHGSPKITGH